jgi:hypothetical protein
MMSLIFFRLSSDIFARKLLERVTYRRTRQKNDVAVIGP